jgi:hypothetical protein
VSDLNGSTKRCPIEEVHPTMVEGSDSGLRLELTASADSYEADDDIILSLYVFNFGDDPVTLNARLAPNDADAPGEVWFEVTGPDEEIIPFGARVNLGRPERSDFLPVAPWNCVGRRYELLSYFNLEEPGSYTVVANYRNEPPRDAAPRGSWTGTLRSNPVTFRLE